ncbi:MAG TPA: GrpB family protein [Gaiellaceae bacterium]|nr:GrpB family protein [Gaiellaceae bacterium]
MAYDPSWPERFDEERRLLEDALAPWLVRGVHHVGSTAVPGLAAKPVVDVLAGVESLEASRPAIEALAPLEYVYAAYRTEYMHWFCKPSPARRTHHLHLIPHDHPQFAARLRFRDALRADPVLAAEYEALKRRLAAEHRDDREAYTDAKAAFVERVSAA